MLTPGAMAACRRFQAGLGFVQHFGGTVMAQIIGGLVFPFYVILQIAWCCAQLYLVYICLVVAVGMNTPVALVLTAGLVGLPAILPLFANRFMRNVALIWFANHLWVGRLIARTQSPGWQFVSLTVQFFGAWKGLGLWWWQALLLMLVMVALPYVLMTMGSAIAGRQQAALKTDFPT